MFIYIHILSYKYFIFIFRSKQNLKVREHNILGPYVDGLSQLAVSSFKVIILDKDLNSLAKVIVG